MDHAIIPGRNKTSAAATIATLLSLTKGDVSRTALEKELNDKEKRSHIYKIGDRTFTTRGSDAGPHRDSFREFRHESTREIRDTIDRITHDSLRDHSRDNFVERKDS